MSWFETGALSSFAKTALSSAQKSIDRVLDIQDEEGQVHETADSAPATKSQSKQPTGGAGSQSQEKKATAVRSSKQGQGNIVDSKSKSMIWPVIVNILGNVSH